MRAPALAIYTARLASRRAGGFVVGLVYPVRMTAGELRLTPRGKWATEAPSHCANGHWLGPDRVLVGHAACSCGQRGGHTTWTCRDCGDVQYGLPLSSECSIRTGPDGR